MFDGMEISQFTYFQQAGGLELSPIAAELTYGLERIAMVLQRVDSIFDIEWAPGVKYADVRLQEEQEQSTYVFGHVGVAPDFGTFHRHLFDEYYRLAEALLASRLIWPALEHCLKCSHLFNILDSSNSIGVTERTAFILRIRKLAVGIARAYVEGSARLAEAGDAIAAAGEGGNA
jgi:glycyl-tRNA synthetase alpha chain